MDGGGAGGMGTGEGEGVGGAGEAGGGGGGAVLPDERMTTSAQLLKRSVGEGSGQHSFVQAGASGAPVAGSNCNIFLPHCVGMSIEGSKQGIAQVWYAVQYQRRTQPLSQLTPAGNFQLVVTLFSPDNR